MRSLAIAAAMISCPGLAGCSTVSGAEQRTAAYGRDDGVPQRTAASDGAPSLRRLRGSEIGSLVAGRTMSFLAEPGVLAVTSHSRTIFMADGTLVLAGDRGTSRGRYTVLRDRLCLRIESARETRGRLFISGDGSHYLQWDGDGVSRRRVPISLE
jgi:hypothetical protein